MGQQDEFEKLKTEFNLKDSDFYFLDLIPLIEMIWADGINQQSELKLLYKFVIEHIAALDQQASLHSISIADANSFLERFAHQKPNPRLTQDLLRLFFNKKSEKQKNQTILEYCLDIAAACTAQYPFGLRQRIMDQEKQLLEKIISGIKY